MLSIGCTCPYCSNEGTTVECLGPIRETKEMEFRGTVKRRISSYAVVSCCKCGEVFIVFFEDWDTCYKEATACLKNWERTFPFRPQIIKTLPEPEEAPTEEVYPEKVNKYLEIIHRHFKTTSSLNKEDAAVIIATIRSVLEYSLKYLNIGNEEDSLYQRIEKAYKEGFITRAIKDWAHIVRKWGNKAVYELEVEPKEASEAYEFMKFMLYFLFKVPYEVKKWCCHR